MTQTQFSNSPITGSITALVTPMHPNGNIDWDSLARLIEWQVTQGTHALVAVGTTGESATLSMQEHIDVIAFFVKHVAGRVPVIAGTGANNTKEAIKLTQDAKDVGADAALLVAPYYNKPTQEGLYQHYKAVAEAVDIPQMLYNVPGRTVVDIANETVLRLADIDNIFAIKDATGNVIRGTELINALAGRMTVFSGDDATALELIKAGAVGNISVTSNVAPKLMSEALSAALAGEHDKAAQINAKIAHLHNVLFVESSPIPVKFALHKMAKIEEGIRLPLTWLLPKYHEMLTDALTQADLI